MAEHRRILLGGWPTVVTRDGDRLLSGTPRQQPAGAVCARLEALGIRCAASATRGPPRRGTVR